MVTLSIEDAAKEAIKRPSDFGYSGDRSLFETWGMTGITVCRDSKPLEKSNWDTITSDLLERFPDECEVMGSSHWAVGWSDELICQVYDDDGDITKCFEAVYDWAEKLSEYPVADDEHHSKLEYEDTLETLKSCYNVPD